MFGLNVLYVNSLIWITTTTVLSQFLSGLSLGVGFESGKKKGGKNRNPESIFQSTIPNRNPGKPRGFPPSEFFRYDLASKKQRPRVVPQRP